MSGSQLEHGEQVCGVLFVARGESSEVLDPVEEAARFPAASGARAENRLAESSGNPRHRPCGIPNLLTGLRNPGQRCPLRMRLNLDIAPRLLPLHGVKAHPTLTRACSA